MRLDELLDDLALEEGAAPEPDEEGPDGPPSAIAGGAQQEDEGANDPVMPPQGAETIFAFNPTGMKFV